MDGTFQLYAIYNGGYLIFNAFAMNPEKFKEKLIYLHTNTLANLIHVYNLFLLDKLCYYVNTKSFSVHTPSKRY